MSEFKKGDRVRVTFEGIVNQENPTYVRLDDDERRWVLEYRVDRGVTVEKIDPPVEEFKPGDRVRHRVSGGEFTVGEGGAFSHQTYRWLDGALAFKSTHYELVRRDNK